MRAARGSRTVLARDHHRGRSCANSGPLALGCGTDPGETHNVKHKTVEPEPVGARAGVMLGSSVVPAIDELVAQFTGRGLVSGAEVVDMLLDLRLIALAGEVAASAV